MILQLLFLRLTQQLLSSYHYVYDVYYTIICRFVLYCCWHAVTKL